VTDQLRMYTIKPGVKDEFVECWRSAVVPLRRRFGFEVVGSWTVDDSDDFVWIIRHDGEWDAADAAYYGSPERKAMEPDPVSFLAKIDTRLMTPISPD